MTGWLLDSLEIEGFRGINNEGDPLILKFGGDSINSISAPNGSGKSSIFDAVAFAIRRTIPKLDELPAAERGSAYYVNLFHNSGIGTISLTLFPDTGGAPVRITVTRAANGTRTVTGPAGIDAEALLSSLNEDFVLLDHKTLQTFIDERALDRGRSFAGLLGLARCSALRQRLQGLANTRAYNNHVNAAVLTQRLGTAEAQVTRYQTAARAAFEALTQQALADQPDFATATARAHDALNQIAILKPHCDGKRFDQIVIDDCLATIRVEEGGADKERLAALLREQPKWESLITAGPTDDDKNELLCLTSHRDQALAATSGTLLQNVYLASRAVLSDESWPNKHLCPVCGNEVEHSLLDDMHAKLANYEAVESLRDQITATWATKNWAGLIELETSVLAEGETPKFSDAARNLPSGALTAPHVQDLWGWRETLLQRATGKLDQIKAERLALEQRLPPSLVAVTTKVEAARRLQESWRYWATAAREVRTVKAEQAKNERVKSFIDSASGVFAQAEADASTRRLAAVEPIFQQLFGAIMFEPVKPAFVKPIGGEELSLSLSEFWSLRNVSAQALLSESFRNAFAVSVYLAAASLYRGSASFMILDDVTSSFDAGHQFHLMEVIRTRFARPGHPTGPQVILLSHDTLLEKYFNKNANQAGWQHQRLEGTARTAILPQSNAANRVRDATINFLNAGQVDDAAPRLRQYLEFKLLEVITRVQIPVPVDFAVDDHSKLPQTAIDAIDSAVKLHQAARTLVLSPAQISNLGINIATITGNFLAHYATGSTHAFSASSLLGVMAAIETYTDCFKFEDPTGSGQKRYYRSLSRRN